MQNREELRQQNLAMIADWQQSGLSQKQYCLQNNIAYHLFHYWYKQYRTKEAAASAGGFTPLTVGASSFTGCVELQLPDGKKILFHQPVPADYLKALIG